MGNKFLLVFTCIDFVSQPIPKLFSPFSVYPCWSDSLRSESAFVRANFRRQQQLFN